MIDLGSVDIYMIYSICLVVIFVADTILVSRISHRGSDLKNQYYESVKKFGLMKATLLKFAMVLWVLWANAEHTFRMSSILTIATIYLIAVVKLFLDYNKSKKQKAP